MERGGVEMDGGNKGRRGEHTLRGSHALCGKEREEGELLYSNVGRREKEGEVL